MVRSRSASVRGLNLSLRNRSRAVRNGPLSLRKRRFAVRKRLDSNDPTKTAFFVTVTLKPALNSENANMQTPYVKVAQMAVKARAFANSRVADFTHEPPQPADAKHAATIAKLDAAITGLGGAAAIQEGRGFEEASGEKAVTFHDLEDLVRRTNKTAGAIADDTGHPEIMDSFRMPHGHGTEEWKTRASSMATAIGTLGLDTEFAAHNLPNHAAALTTAAANFDASAGEQGSALGKQTGATELIPTQIKTIKSAVKTLDALYENTYSGQPDVIGAWKSQSHVEKVASKKKSAAPATGGATGSGGASPAADH